MADFTHFNDQGRAKMVDVGGKPISQRVAVAAGRVLVNEHTFALIQSGGMKKGDVLTVAQIAGVMGAKRTPDIIPMCHPILMDGINLELSLDEHRSSVEIKATVSCDGRTGVEMEALTAVSTAALAVYDMCKAVQNHGHPPAFQNRRNPRRLQTGGRIMAYTAAVITISDKGYRGEREDTSGPNLVKILTEKGFDVTYTAIVPDEAEMIQSELLKCADEKKIALVLTTGGTGFSPRDITPEAAMEVIQRPTPGIPEAMRAESMKITPKGCLSRSVAGIRARTLIITLPGSQKASAENILAVIDPVAHGLDMLYSEGSADCAK